MDIVIGVWLFAVGAVFGSFALATVWRLRAKELAANRVDSKEYQQLVKKSKLDRAFVKNDRSKCLSCQHQLSFWDLIPIISWLWLGGRCRYCRAKIGYAEVLIEIVMGLLFVISAKVLNLDPVLLALWLLLVVALSILFIYDLKWMLMPTAILYLAIGLAGVFGIVVAFNQVAVGVPLKSVLVNQLLAWMILSGLYSGLSLISQEKWIGMGDGYLGLALSLTLGDWKLAFVVLFLANLLGSLMVLVRLTVKKQKIKGTRVPLGPLLITAFVVVFLLRQNIMSYLSFWFDI